LSRAIRENPESNSYQIVCNIPDDVQPYLHCFTVVPFDDDGRQYLDGLIRRSSPGVAYQDPRLSDYDMILEARKPKAGWKINISWRAVMTLFLWQTSHYAIEDPSETDSEIALARPLVSALSDAARRQKARPRSLPRPGTPISAMCALSLRLLLVSG
jgi:hypothetical protein